MSGRLCQDPILEADVQSAINSLDECLERMLPAERVATFQRIHADYCPHCGKETHGHICHCRNDE